MADPEQEELGADEQVRRSVGRTIANWTVVLLSLGIIGAWLPTGYYELAPGEAAVILRLGAFDRTRTDEGPWIHLPVPLERHEIVNVAEIRKHAFGLRPVAPGQPAKPLPQDTETPQQGEVIPSFSNAIQTNDSNIVNLGYVLQYEIEDPFPYRFGMAEPLETLYDTTRSAVREVVGRMTVDDVLTERREDIQDQARTIVRERIKSYLREAGKPPAFGINAILLQVVQAPEQVQAAFDDVVAAQQDEERQMSEARGDAKETLERARAQAAELEQRSIAYKEAKIVEARGQAQRFVALLGEYERAPEVTRRRLYLETMEEVLPDVEKLIVEPGSASFVPFFSPLAVGQGRGTPPVATPAPEPADTAREETR